MSSSYSPKPALQRLQRHGLAKLYCLLFLCFPLPIGEACGSMFHLFLPISVEASAVCVCAYVSACLCACVSVICVALCVSCVCLSVEVCLCDSVFVCLWNSLRACGPECAVPWRRCAFFCLNTAHPPEGSLLSPPGILLQPPAVG